jgi:hypothetical protein
VNVTRWQLIVFGTLFVVVYIALALVLVWGNWP